MIRALNWKAFERGAIVGFIDLGYGGLVVKGCRVMKGPNGYWLALPQREGEKEGERAWFDIMYLTKPEADHVRRVVVEQLKAEGHLNGEQQAQRRPPQQQRPQTQQTFIDEGMVLPEHVTAADDDIPF